MFAFFFEFGFVFTCQERNSKRKNFAKVPKKIIETMFEKFENPKNCKIDQNYTIQIENNQNYDDDEKFHLIIKFAFFFLLE